MPRFLMRPDTPTCVAGKPVAMYHDWLWIPVGPAIGMPQGMRVPRCLDHYQIHRWAPRIGIDDHRGLPMWKPETLHCYRAAQPTRICWDEAREWL